MKKMSPPVTRWIPVASRRAEKVFPDPLGPTSPTINGTAPRFAFSFMAFLRYQLRSLWLRLTGRWHRYGYACVSFGRPVSLRAYLASRGLDLRALPPDARRAEVQGRRPGNEASHASISANRAA